MAHFPARLHVLLARDSPLGVVIRRGPSKSVCTLLWDRTRDSFALGQWMRGRIYERRCDLSPDGKHLIYFAMNGRWDSETKGAWTAISRTLYLKAVILLVKGDCGHGGGLFISNKSYWLNAGHGHTTLHNSLEVRQDTKFVPSAYYGGECTGVYYLRLLRDGWRLVKLVSKSKWKDVDVFEKSLRGGWVLRKFAHAEVGSPPGKGCYWDEHEIEQTASATRIQCADWEWAEADRKSNRLGVRR